MFKSNSSRAGSNQCIWSTTTSCGQFVQPIDTDRYCKKDMCDKWKKLEEVAKQSKAGLWSMDNPVEPWMYRRKGKK